MEALDLLKGAKRMCRNFTCEECPLCSKCIFLTPSALTDSRLEEVVAVVEEWVKDNPQKTNAQKFEEVFGWPQADIDSIRYAQAWWDEPYKEPGGRNER